MRIIKKDVERILQKVQKPGRYVGGERGAVIKDKSGVNLRVAFCFPDVYEVGMSHLGMKILYSLYNSQEGIWCERVFAPWVDMEQQMRENGILLYGLESGDALHEFDIIAFTLQYELSYTNILNMLSLGGIPLLARDRQSLKNLVIAGGPCASNPEPLADFVDLFFIGEGEESSLEAFELYERCKKEGKTKREFIELACKIEGVYAPSLYDTEYNDDGTLKSVTPCKCAPEKVKKRIVSDLDKLFYPHEFVVPMIDIVHDRAVSEIFRGCIRGCRFCQAGFLYRPVREKSADTISRQSRELCKNTGYDEVSLSSLSSSDYTKITELLEKLTEWSDSDGVSLSLPSLRVDGFNDEILSKLKTVRKSGLTFAPEAGTQRLRDAINKNVTENELMNTCKTAFAGGWTGVKLYFMIGLPTETPEDIEGIAALGQSVVNEYYKAETRAKGKGVRVTLSASSFVPKPFTPFQWYGQNTIEELESKQKLLKNSIKTKKITFNYHDADTSFLEAVFARGDRRLGRVLLKAHEKGLKFDGWSDFFSLKSWLAVLSECAVDPHFYANRQRDYDELLPWDHIDYGIKKEFLIDECKKAYNSETTKNCREECTSCGAAQWKGGVCLEGRKDMV